MITNHYCHHEGKPRPWAVGAFSDHMARQGARRHPLAAKVRQVHGRYTVPGTVVAPSQVQAQARDPAPHMCVCGVTPRKIASAAKTRVSHWAPLFSPLPEYYGQLAVSADDCWRASKEQFTMPAFHQSVTFVKISTQMNV